MQPLPEFLCLSEAVHFALTYLPQREQEGCEAEKWTGAGSEGDHIPTGLCRQLRSQKGPR